jgi:hypothetical protein
MENWLKYGLIGFGTAVVIIILSMIIPVLIFIISLPAGKLFCNVFYSCQGEFAGLRESFTISSVLMIIIFTLIGILIGKTKSK